MKVIKGGNENQESIFSWPNGSVIWTCSCMMAICKKNLWFDGNLISLTFLLSPGIVYKDGHWKTILGK